MEGDTVKLPNPQEKTDLKSPSFDTNGFEEKPMTDPDCLTTNRIYIVNNLDIEDVYPSLLRYKCLTNIEIEKIENNKHIRELIDSVDRRGGPPKVRLFNNFIKITAGTNPGVFHTLVGRKPSEEETEFCIKGIVETLREDIKKKGHCTDSPFDEKIDLDYQHVQLSIVKNTPQDEASSNSNNMLPHTYQTYIESLNNNIEVKNILDVAAENQQPKILIQGRAGVGKTTTFQWFGRRWALREWAIQFTMIFLLQLRYLINSEDKMSALELLTKTGLFKFNNHLDGEICMSWLKNYANQAMLLVDGLDEIFGFADKMRKAPEIKDITHKASPIDIIVNILRGNLFPGMTIICTSRPFSGLGELTGFAKVEILGLTRSGVEEFVKQRHTKDCKNIMSVLERIPILMSLCSITFYCSIITSLLSENILLEEEDIKTYTRLIAFIIVRHVSRLQDRWPFIVEVNAYFAKLSHLAYTGIFNSEQPFSKLVFNEFDLVDAKLNPADLEMIKPVGLLYMKDYESRGDKSISAEFMHLSIQEMLAVVYCLSDRFITSEFFSQVFSDGQFDMALMYLFGLYFDQKSIWIKKILAASGYKFNESIQLKINEFFQGLVNSPVINDSLKVKLCQLAHESQVDSHAKSVGPVLVQNHSLVLNQVPMTALDLRALNFVCRYAEEITTLVLRGIGADDTLVSVLSSSFLKKHGDKLQNLDLSMNVIGPVGARCLTDAMSSNKSLHTFCILGNNLQAEGAEVIAKMLRNKDNVRELNIASNNIGNQGAKAIVEVLLRKKRFLNLNISANNIQGGEAMVDIIRKSTSLKNLNIAVNNIGDKGISDLQKGQISNSHLQALNIAFNNITSDGAEMIRSILSASRSIVELNLSGNHLGASGAKTLSSSIGGLVVLDISANHIGSEGASAISEVLQGNKKMKSLNMSVNDIGAVGAIGVANMLGENKTLRGLDLNANNIGVIGANKLAEALTLTTGLHQLIISGNDTGVFGQLAITKAAATRNIQVVSGSINVNSEQLKVAAILGQRALQLQVQATATVNTKPGEGGLNLRINFQSLDLKRQ